MSQSESSGTGRPASAARTSGEPAGRVDLLCFDELGYMELDRRGAELLFQVLIGREETHRIAIAIASNASFSGWTEIFTDLRLCAAIVVATPSAATSSGPIPAATASLTRGPNAQDRPK